MSKPYENLVILDLTHVLAGPFASTMMSDLGATIIKVERPGIGDDTRAFPPFVEGQSAYFAGLNHGKQSIALDLKSPSDREVFERLLQQADVLLENFRPGVMEKLGYGWDSLHEKHPRLIYGAVSGFGHTGPDSQKPAYDMVVQGRGGVMSITGEKDREPVRVGASIGDIVAGLYLAQGVSAALYQREQTGQGQKIDVAMLDCQLAILEHAVAITGATGTPPGRTGARHPTITPFETFHASDGLFVIAAGNDALFQRLCDALELPDLPADPQFATNAARCDNARLLKRLIEAVTLSQTKAHWIEVLTKAGVPTGPIQNVAEALEDPQLLARNMVATVQAGTDRPSFLAAGNPIKMTSVPDTTSRDAAPLLDGDREAILQWLASKESTGS
ncbi:CaiB/BaiF CoA transferase family protein [Actibacterium pelagium]|uniref:Acetyl-CoA:oxalate CoA-transferase n=1 Tax=Actibacterium pelagium TaxID=2029103 RepID=A0A917EGR7_9RHOB|nr:CoA transferase [Actibacterium pelagium]GGE41575.1 acetyl-CoA:oxalate CoA-transferase [Actibacterium pelagium]